MKRHPRTVAVVARRWAVPALFAVIVIGATAGCTSAAQPSASAAAPAVSAHVAAPATSTNATASALHAVTQTTTSTPSTAKSPAASRTTSSSTPVRTRASARRATAAPAHTAAPVGGASAAAAPTTSKRARPADPTSSRAVATSSPRPPTTPVPPPAQGNIHQTVPAETPATLQAAPLTERAQPETGIAVEVTDIRAVTTEARFPGEIAGPGLAVTIHVVNSSATAIDLDNAIVDVRGSDGSRGIAVSGSPAAPMSGSLPPGQQATGVYVFTIPLDQRSPISVRFSYAAGTPTVLFVGDAQ